MTLQATTLAIRPYLTADFHASAGTAPYTYSVLPGGVGGTIDSDGLYTAPAATGLDVVRATDALGATADLQILIGQPLELICDIIQKELGLANGRVVIWDQKFMLPKDSGLVIAVRVFSLKPFGNSTSYAVNGGLDAVQSINVMARLDINIMSRGKDARDRKEEVLLALNSVYAQQQMASNSFAIARLSSAFLDLSEVDGAAIPYRFVISVNAQYSLVKTKAAPYYGTFEDVDAETEP